MTNCAQYPSLAGRHVLISGGSSGIGAALVEAFALQQSNVTFLDILPGEHLERRWPQRVKFLSCDVTDTDRLQATIREAISNSGPVDVLINNAAQDERVGLMDLTEVDWDRYVGINLKHYAFATQAVVPGMRDKQRGVVLNVGSIAWRVKVTGMPAYTACKAAVGGLTRPLARELGRYGIRVNTLSPGATLTERQRRLWRSDEVDAEIQNAQCLAGDVMPSDVAAVALFLSSDDARMCTGQEFIVDGGWA